MYTEVLTIIQAQQVGQAQLHIIEIPMDSIHTIGVFRIGFL